MLLWIAGVALCLVLGSLDSSLAMSEPHRVDLPLCSHWICNKGEERRLMETCDSNNTCHVNFTCQPKDWVSTVGCVEGSPLLNDKGELRTCYTENQCPDDFYCSTEVQDVASRCCHTHPRPVMKDGECPAPSKEEYHFCVDECLSDSDCRGHLKCCNKSETCPRGVCLPPDPCSTKWCPTGFECKVDVLRKARCVPPCPSPIPESPYEPLEPV